MIEESELNVLVSNVLSQNHYSHCRLCLKDIQDEYVRFYDSVSVGSSTFKPLSEILTVLLGEEICEDIAGVDAVCEACIKTAIVSYKFLGMCGNSTKLLNNIFNNLCDTLSAEIDTNANYNLYISINKTETKLFSSKKKGVKKSYNFKRGGLKQNQKFECTKCLEIFDDISELDFHYLTIHPNLFCEKCFTAVSTEEEYNAHETSSMSYKCTECDFLTCTEDTLKFHQELFHEIVVCKDCGKSFNSMEKLQKHEMKHTISKSECPKCGKSYNTKGFFLKHVKLCLQDLLDPHPMRSNKKKTHFCDMCGKGYSTPGGLRVHNRFVHGNAKPHVCEYCNKQFTAPSYLKVHILKHTGEKNFKCDLCNKLFVSKEALLYHTRRHLNDKPYSCTMCDEKFVNASARAEHIKFKHFGPTLMCEICSHKFYTTSFLKQHIKKHHDPTNKLYAGRSLIPPNVPAVENMRVKLYEPAS